MAGKLAFLGRAASYADGSRRIEVIETHFAWVFLTARYAYKLKKPLRQMRMDYRTLARRERGCREELALNRRLAPDVYLAVVALSIDRFGALRLGRSARVVDWLVKMRRLPASRLLDQLLVRRSLQECELDALIGLLVHFFDGAAHRPMHPSAYVARLRRQVLENREALRPLSPRSRNPADRVTDAQLEWIERARATLAARAARLVDGHGDLRPEHVCLEPSPSVIDCLEFDPELRRLDPLEELAFLALEVERLGRPALALEIVRRFRLGSGETDDGAVMHFYMSHQAATRAKLAAWHIGDPQFPDPRPWRARAHTYIRDAHRHARQALRELPHPDDPRDGAGRDSGSRNGARRPLEAASARAAASKEHRSASVPLPGRMAQRSAER